MKKDIDIKQELRGLDELITYILEIIGSHTDEDIICDGIKKYAESYHKMRLKRLGFEDEQSIDSLMITKMIEENKSILAMAETHMDMRDVIVLKDRIKKLELMIK